jgi:predicted RNase H-like nuclease (RuvC/YqgF family)
MMTLPQVEKFYKTNKHLPNVPSAAELEKTGLDMVKTDAKLMEKIEELTIYMVDLNKQVQSLKAENSKLKKQVSQLKK